MTGDVTRLLRKTSDEGLLRTFAALTHRLHAADQSKRPDAGRLTLDLRFQRDTVREEILRRMRA